MTDLSKEQMEDFMTLVDTAMEIMQGLAKSSLENKVRLEDADIKVILEWTKSYTKLVNWVEASRPDVTIH